jgi:hypothetical protein
MRRACAAPERKMFRFSAILNAYFSSFVTGIGLAAQGLNR